MDRVQKKIDTLKMQKTAQAQDTEAAKELLAEAITDMEVRRMDKKSAEGREEGSRI